MRKGHPWDDLIFRALRHAWLFDAYSIVMQNRLAARYSGEVYLVKHDLPFEARSNVIGFVGPEYVNLFDQINTNKLKLSMKKARNNTFQCHFSL